MNLLLLGGCHTATAMWKPVDTEFQCPRIPVEIVDLGGSGEGESLRSILENLHCVVLCHWIGAPMDFLKVISQGTACAPYLIVSGHGYDGHLTFGQYADHIDTSMLINGRMPPTCVEQHVRLPDCTVINTCCSGGTKQLARAFLKGRLRAYIGSVDDVEGDAVPLFIGHFFYQLPRVGFSVRKAWEFAASYDDESRQFVLYDRRGRCYRLH